MSAPGRADADRRAGGGIRVVRLGEGVRGAVYVGRPVRSDPGSPLGNPFRIGRDGTRAEVIAKYRAWLRARLAERSQARAAFDALLGRWRDEGALVLACWCAPLACHADVIAEELRRAADRAG